MNFDNTFVRIDLDAIEANIDAIRSRVGVDVMAVIKADAYGHGAIQVARLLQDKCSFFGVSSMLEAMELRRAGLYNPILILGHTPLSAFRTAIQAEIRPTIYTYEAALALSLEAQRIGKTAAFHFAVDTGMSRIGFQATREDAEACARIASMPGLHAEGIFTHFATADCADLSRSWAQKEKFDNFCAMLAEYGVEIPIRHVDNSAGLMNFDDHYEMVRSGIVTYGMYPSSEVDPDALPLRPALQWLSRVTHVKTLEPGREISYGGTYVTTKETRVATVPVGYADGYRRSLSNKFYVLIRGKRAPILGRVCMDQLMVDVTHIRGGVAPEEPVVLFGRTPEGTVGADEVMASCGGIAYELLCGVNKRVPRVYLKDGAVESVSNILPEFEEL